MIELRPIGSDNTGQIVDALRRAESTRQPISLVSDTFVLQAPILLTPKGGFHTVKITGEQMGSSFGPCRRTFIDASAITDGYVFGIQDARHVEVSNLTLFGGTRGGATGIAIDPQDTQQASSWVDFEKVHIEGFGTGLVISPAVSTNADRVKFRLGAIYKCDIGYSVGQSQARANTIEDSDISFCGVGIHGSAHGKRQGTAPKVVNCQFGVLDQVFDFPCSFGSPLAFWGGHIESVASLGRYGPRAASRQPLVFRDMYMNLRTGVSTPAGTFTYNLESAAHVILDGCQIESDGKRWRVESYDPRGSSLHGALDIVGPERTKGFYSW